MTNEPTNILAAPVSQQERILIIDSLRGIAILGILLMNIPGFGMPLAAAFDYSSTAAESNKFYFLVCFRARCI
ncbi:MAG: hypothetical protein HC867_00840 [Bacteroidia bacterium]|nr:hypothetical protein [Bacteroidia bacterium]